MITRMEITYKSKLPCVEKPAIFTTGGYRVKSGDRELHFDFEDMEAVTEIKDGHLYVHSLQKNLDESLFDGFSAEEADAILRNASREDFTEFFYECYADQGESITIELKPLSVTFYDFSSEGDGTPIEVDGYDFSSLSD